MSWLGRVSHRVAFRLDARMFAELAGRPPRGDRASVGRVALLAASLVLFLLLVAGLVWGLWLALHDFPGLGLVPGLLVIAAVWMLRPRFGGTDGAMGVLYRDDAPELFALLDDVAAQLRAPVPEFVVVEPEFNAAAGTVGIGRKRMLRLGLPLWAVLDAQQRVAVLAHELGHFVHRDPTRSLLVQPALTMLGELATALTPARPALPREGDPLGHLWWLVKLGAGKVFALLAKVLSLVQLGLLWLAARDRQRAEYRADATAAKIAGTAATLRLLDDSMQLAAIRDAVRAVEPAPEESEAELEQLESESAEPAVPESGIDRWRAAADGARVRSANRLEALRKRSVRTDASLFADHPPAGLRAMMVESWPVYEPVMVLTDEDSELIDRELEPWFAQAEIDLARCQQVQS